MAISLLGRPWVHGFKVWRARHVQWCVQYIPLWASPPWLGACAELGILGGVGPAAI
jgi:hypothetical protein